MFGKFLISIVFLSVLACAHSNYTDLAQNSAKGAVQEQLGSCDLEFKQSKLCASFSWDTKPFEQKPGAFVLEFHGDQDTSQFADLVGTLGVVLWMPSMGHSTSPVNIEHLGMGQYRVSNVNFTMRGDWEIRVQIKSGNMVVEQAVYPVRF